MMFWHWFNLIFYVAIFIGAIRGMHIYARIHKDMAVVSKLLIPLYVAAAIQSLFFVGLQTDWILNRSDAIPDITSIAWQIFNYLNGFVILSYIFSLNIYLFHRYARKTQEKFSKTHS